MNKVFSRRQILGATTAVGVATGLEVLAAGPASASTLAPRAVGGAAVSAAAPARSVPWPTGYSTGSDILFGTYAEIDSTLDSIVAANATEVRFDIMWYFIQPTKTTFNWTVTDYVVNGAVARGLNILGILLSCPAWAGLYGQSAGNQRPASAATYATFCKTVAARYKGKIDAYEIWNEPNSDEFFAPNPDAAFYASMVKAAYPAIKSADPSATVVVGSLGPAPDGDGTISPMNFVNTMYSNGVKGYFDAFSFHPYYQTMDVAQGAFYDNTPMRIMGSIHAAMKAKGDGAKKIWITEYGITSSSSFSQDQQANLIAATLQEWGEVDFAGPFYIYTVRDSSSAAWGSVTTNFTPKKALWAVQYLQNQGMPLRDIAVAFNGNADSSLGDSVSAIYSYGGGYVQEFENGSRYLASWGWVSSPTAVATLARYNALLPTTPFANGYQDFYKTGGFRIFWSAATGAHSISGAFVTAYKNSLGLATTDQYQYQWSSSIAVDFQNGRLVYNPNNGATTLTTF